MKTLQDQVYDVFPGESLDIFFPEGFELSYVSHRWGEKDEVKTFICERVNVYYWDDDDHRCKDLYFYEANTNNDPWHTWTCKEYSLTPESRKKLTDYLANNYDRDARKNN